MSTSSNKVIIAAMIGNLIIAFTKFVASVVTGSSAMFSEGIHSVVDTGNQILLLYGIHRSKKPADEKFPFGYGKEIYFWSFVVAILIFAVGAGVSIYEGIHRLIHPSPIENPVLNYFILGIAMVLEGASWYFAWKEFSRTKGKWGYIEAIQRGKDPSLFTVLFEDTAAMLGLVIALLANLLGQLTGIAYFDGLASVLIGLILAGTAIWLAHETKGLLIGESANTKVVQGIREIIASYRQVKHINEVLTMHMGPDFILVNVSVDFFDETTAAEIEALIAKLDRKIKQTFPMVKRVFVEAEAISKHTEATVKQN